MDRGRDYGARAAHGGGRHGRVDLAAPAPARRRPIRGTYAPSIDPANFVTTIDNRFFPLKPGTGFHYKGVREGTPQRDDEIVTRTDP